MIAILLVLGVLLWAGPAYAFSSLLFLDPAFQVFIAIQVPIIGSIAMGMWEGIAVKIFFSSHLEKINVMLAVLAMFRANIGMMVIYVLVSIIVGVIAWEPIKDAPHPIVGWIAVAYFGGLYAHYGWKAKVKRLARLMVNLSEEGEQGDSGEDLKNRIEQQKTAIRKPIFWINAVSFIALFGYLYWYLF